MPFIEIKDLTFGYSDSDGNRIPVINGMDLSIEKGEFVAILGRNGSGKSTLAKLINYILEPDGGSVTVDGIALSPDISDKDLMTVRRTVGMVFQNPDNQLVATVVEEEVAFGPENLGVPPDEIRERVYGALETVGMKSYAKHAPSRLSGGQKQRVAIAGVLAMRPECLILDEATAMLDPAGREEVLGTVLSLRRETGITVIHITHDMSEAALADRVIVIDGGKIALEGSAREVFAQADRLIALGLTAPEPVLLCRQLRAAGADIPEGILTEDEAVNAILKIYKEKHQ